MRNWTSFIALFLMLLDLTSVPLISNEAEGARFRRGRAFGRRAASVSRGRRRGSVRVARRGGRAGAGRARVAQRQAAGQGREEIKPIVGFSEVVETTSGRFLEPDLTNPRRFREIFDPRTGRFRNNIREGTKQQFMEFALKNLFVVSGQKQETLRRVLAANGAGDLTRGDFLFDLSSGVSPKGTPAYSPMSDADVRIASLNLAINTLNNNIPDIFSIKRGEVGADGLVRKSLNGFIPASSRAFIKASNPYGKCENSVRSDWLIAFAFGKAAYQKISQIPATLEQFAAERGIPTEKNQRLKSLWVMAPPKGATDPNLKESIVNPALTDQEIRTLGVYNQTTGAAAGRNCYISWDAFAVPGSRTESNSRDPRVVGVNRFTHDGSEIICKNPNGFIGSFGLYNAGGQSLQEAPGGLAVDGANPVDNGHSCMKCHANGFRGAGISEITKKEYTDNSNSLPGFSKQFALSNAEYRGFAVPDSSGYTSVVRGSGSGVEGFDGKLKPVIDDTYKEYNNPPSLEQQAKELRTTPQALAAVGGRTMARKDFENEYCNLKARLGQSSRGSVLDGGAGRSGVRGFTGEQHLNGGSASRPSL